MDVRRSNTIRTDR